MKANRSTCKQCGAALLWIEGFSPRPFEADARPTFPGCTAVTLDKRSRELRWVDTLPAAAAPDMANHVHQCRVWRDFAKDPLKVVGGSFR